jgi:FKBP-type peptidyl-prolyl cis-trans isomerase 2
VICGIEIGLVLGVFRDTKVVVKFNSELAGTLDVFVVEVIELCMGFDDVIY